MRSVKHLKVNWKQIEDVLASHLYAVRALNPETDDVIEIILKKNYPKTPEDNEMAELVVYYQKR